MTTISWPRIEIKDDCVPSRFTVSIWNNSVITKTKSERLIKTSSYNDL